MYSYVWIITVQINNFALSVPSVPFNLIASLALCSTEWFLQWTLYFVVSTLLLWHESILDRNCLIISRYSKTYQTSSFRFYSVCAAFKLNIWWFPYCCCVLDILLVLSNVFTKTFDVILCQVMSSQWRSTFYFFSSLRDVCRLTQTRIYPFVLWLKSRLPCSMLRVHLIGYQRRTVWRVYKWIIITRRYCTLTFLELSVLLMRTVRAVPVPMCHVVFIQPCATPLGSPCCDPQCSLRTVAMDKHTGVRVS